MSQKPSSYPSSKLRLIDVVVTGFFIFTAVLGLYLFQQDLLRTFDMRDVEPAGTIVIRNNVVQRRHADRVLWDRIFVDSYVYPGDLIRAGDQSYATVDISSNEISLNENTIIRIQYVMDGSGTFQVELQEGNVSVTSGVDSTGIFLNLMGTQVHTASGTVLNATAGDEGISVEVSEGTAEFIQEGKAREISEGMMIAMDTQGVERIIPAIVVTRPSPNARFLKNQSEGLVINFAWNRINLNSDEKLRLQISDDPHFNRITLSLDDLDNYAQAALDAGQWYWRFLYEDTILRSGWLTIADSSGPTLVSPVNNSVFRYSNTPPQIRFQWEEKQNASRYFVEISDNPQNFANPYVRQTTANSLILSDLKEGTWYWRVRPVFPALFTGEVSYSSIGSFKIEKTADTSAPVIEVPEPVIAIRPEPVNTARPGAVIPLSGRGQQYTVTPGDTLGRIARQFYGDSLQWTRIAEANNIRNPDLIYPGQTFIIP